MFRVTGVFSNTVERQGILVTHFPVAVKNTNSCILTYHSEKDRLLIAVNKLLQKHYPEITRR